MSDETSRMNARIGAYAGTGKPPLPDGIDWFEHLQEPTLPKTSDPLARFVISRIIELETEPRNEIRPLYDQPGGAMAHRYAKHVRADCVVFRQIVAAYLGATHTGRPGLHAALLLVANRWSEHREFDDAWRLT